MRLLVTGGSGFTDCSFVRYLLQTRKEVTIVNFDKLTYAGNTENLADIAEDPPRYRLVHGDIAGADVVERILETGIDGTVNLAAETHVDRSILDSAPFLHPNVLGTQCFARLTGHQKLASRTVCARRWVVSGEFSVARQGPFGRISGETFRPERVESRN